MCSAGDHICKSVTCVSHGLDLSASLSVSGGEPVCIGMT